MRNELTNILYVHTLISSILREGEGGGCITVLSVEVYKKGLKNKFFL
jgi:hypothetical protein